MNLSFSLVSNIYLRKTIMELNILNDKIKLKQTQINCEKDPQKKVELLKQLQKLNYLNIPIKGCHLFRRKGCQ